MPPAAGTVVVLAATVGPVVMVPIFPLSKAVEEVDDGISDAIFDLALPSGPQLLANKQSNIIARIKFELNLFSIVCLLVSGKRYV